MCHPCDTKYIIVEMIFSPLGSINKFIDGSLIFSSSSFSNSARIDSINSAVCKQHNLIMTIIMTIHNVIKTSNLTRKFIYTFFPTLYFCLLTHIHIYILLLKYYEYNHIVQKFQEIHQPIRLLLKLKN